MKIYSLFDKVAKRFVSTTIAESDEMFVRSSLYAICMDYPINDVEYYCVGQFDNELGLIKPCQPRLCSWESYKFPKSRMDKENFLTIEEIEKSAKEKKHEFIKQQKDNILDLERAESIAKKQLKEAETKKDKKRIKELKDIIKEISLEIKNLKEVSNE